MNKKKKSKKRQYDFYNDTFGLINMLLAVFGFIQLVVILVFFRELIAKLLPVQILTIVFAISIYLISLRTEKKRLLRVIFVLYLIFVLLPPFIFYSGDYRSAVPVLLVSFICLMAFCLNGTELFLLSIVSMYFLTFIFLRHGTDIKGTVIGSVRAYYMSFIFAFSLMSVIMIVVFVLQEKNYSNAREEMKKNRDAVKKSVEAKAVFLSSLTGDVRTPLNSIIGLSELILNEEISEENRHNVEIIKNSAYDLLDVIDDVLTYSNLDAGNIDLDLEELRFDKLLNKIMFSVQPLADQDRIIFTLDVDQNIPAVVLCDEFRIRQVFLRLLFVSLQLTDNGRIMVSVSSEKEDDKTVRFKCSVADTGAGLSEADLTAVFDAYGKYDSRQNSNLKGICLKLTICRQLLELMNGSLEVNSIEGVGLESKFDFTCRIVDPSPMVTVKDNAKLNVLVLLSNDNDIPRWKDIMEGFKIRPTYVNSYYTFEKAVSNRKYDYIFVSKEIYPSVSGLISSFNLSNDTYVIGDPVDAYGDFGKCRMIRRPVSCINVGCVLNGEWDPDEYILKSVENEYDGKNAKILVVDDNSVNLKVAAGIFTHYNISIDIAKSGEEALKKMEAKEYHLIFMDLVMIGMSGQETLNRMRESGNKYMKEVPVIALTATTGDNVRNEVISEGFQEYLAKPIKMRYLTQCLEKFLPPGMLQKISHDEKKPDTVDLTKEENILDTAKGISNLGFIEESYFAVLNTYYSEGIRKLSEIRELLDAGDMDLFTTDVHGIKSSSASIGAETVSKMFRELEYAGKERNIEFINANLNAFTESFKKILDDVKEYLTEKGRFEYKEEDKSRFKDVKEETIDFGMLKNFKENIDRMDLKECDSIMTELSSHNFGEEENEFIEKLKKAYDMFDFHEVKALLNERPELA